MSDHLKISIFGPTTFRHAASMKLKESRPPARLSVAEVHGKGSSTAALRFIGTVRRLRVPYDIAQPFAPNGMLYSVSLRRRHVTNAKGRLTLT